MTADPFPLRADTLMPRRPARILGLDWDALDEASARRLQEFGVDDGVSIELLHAGPLGGDPLALRIGRMTVALRRRQAAAIFVEPVLS